MELTKKVESIALYNLFIQPLGGATIEQTGVEVERVTFNQCSVNPLTSSLFTLTFSYCTAESRWKVLNSVGTVKWMKGSVNC